MSDMQAEIGRLLALPAGEARRDGVDVVAQFRDGLNRGDYRAAEKVDGVWRANTWVKQGILLAFRIGVNENRNLSEEFRFRDKDTLPLRPGGDGGPRVVPGGSSIRDGAYVGNSVICMPPMFINIGAWVDDHTMVDSHALVGSCAQIGKRVHLSAAAQIGGVLEPPGAVPVIIEDDVFVGGNCGVYEGVIVCERAVLAPGVLLTGGVTVYDTVHGKEYRRKADAPLIIPSGAVLVPGSRPATGRFAEQKGLSLYAPIIIGVISAAVVVAPTLTLLLEAYGIGVPTETHPDPLAAPQATLMASVARGVFEGGLPINMVVIGMVIAVTVIVLDLYLEKHDSKFRTPVLALAVGIYLPLELSVPIALGGVIAYQVAKRTTGGQDNGILFSAGLITGEALVGIGMAIPIVIYGRADIMAFWGIHEGNIPGIVLLALVAYLLYRAGMSKRQTA